MSKSLTSETFYSRFGLNVGLRVVICGWFSLELGFICGGWLGGWCSSRYGGFLEVEGWNGYLEEEG